VRFKVKKRIPLKKRPPQITDLHEKICECIDTGKYVHSYHALERHKSREIGLEDVLYVLKHGIHEKRKTTFADDFQSWKYAIRGKTLDNDDIRVIIAFDDSGMIVITVMYVLPLR
jgi:hypothetical protein